GGFDARICGGIGQRLAEVFAEQAEKNCGDGVGWGGRSRGFGWRRGRRRIRGVAEYEVCQKILNVSRRESTLGTVDRIFERQLLVVLHHDLAAFADEFAVK